MSADIEPDPEHRCAEHFADIGELEPEGVTIYEPGRCTECGRAMAKVYEFAGWLDEADGELVEEH